MYNEIQSPAQVPVKYVSVQCRGGAIAALYSIFKREAMCPGTNMQ